MPSEEEGLDMHVHYMRLCEVKDSKLNSKIKHLPSVGTINFEVELAIPEEDLAVFVATVSDHIKPAKFGIRHYIYYKNAWHVADWRGFWRIWQLGAPVGLTISQKLTESLAKLPLDDWQ